MPKTIKLSKEAYVDMSHNINNPLTIINGHICKGTFSEKDKEELKDAVKRIHEYLSSLEFYITEE